MADCDNPIADMSVAHGVPDLTLNKRLTSASSTPISGFSPAPSSYTETFQYDGFGKLIVSPVIVSTACVICPLFCVAEWLY
jgi:hypothetical protein